MGRLILVLATLCFLAAILRTIVELRARMFRPLRFNFIAIGAGFTLQTGFLTLRGHSLGRCPLTNLFEVFVFLAWSVALIYLLIGPTYRLSLMGAFTAPLIFGIQAFALLAPIDTPHKARVPANGLLELHASVSMIAYGAFALACIAGAMYLAQDRQLKTHHLHTIFYHLPPLDTLYAAITRLLWSGFALYTVGLISGFFVGHPLPYLQIFCAVAVWILYAIILEGRHLRKIAPKRVAALSILGFSAALTLLWGITFTAQMSSPP